MIGMSQRDAEEGASHVELRALNRWEGEGGALSENDM
jgi:hypothetical protein